MIALAMCQFLLASVGGVAGNFADGGAPWERAILTIVHPLAAIGLLILVFVPNLKPVGLRIVRLLLGINLTADLILAALIVAGTTRGDWWLPLLFSVIPLLGLAYSYRARVPTSAP